jgi:hypothetical protein
MSEIKSTRFSLNAVDWKKWVYNTALFFAPAMLAVITALQQDADADAIYWILRLWLLNTAVDILRKFLQGKPR